VCLVVCFMLLLVVRCHLANKDIYIFLYVRLFVCVAFLLVDCGSVSGFMFDCMCFCCLQRTKYIKKLKVAQTRLPSVGFRS